MSASARAEANPARPPGGPVPKGFVAKDLTFVSTRTGWLLGTAPCTVQPCTSIVRTTDSGGTWVGIPAPKADLEPNGQSGCAGKPCVRGLRFANLNIGYAYGSTALYLTTDGGATWSTQPGQADAIEVSNGTALRISHDTQGCPPGCTYQVSTAAVGTTDWHPVDVPGSPLVGNGVQLLRTGHHAYAEIYRNPAGGASNAQATLLTSTDDGQHWAVRADPCGGAGDQEADSTQLAVADDGSLTALCRLRVGGTTSFVVTSSDGGATFGAHHPAPADGAYAVGAADASTPLLAVATGNTTKLYRGTGAGASWTVVATVPAAAPTDGSLAVIGFEDARTGRFAPGTNAFLSTADAGQTWVAYTFR
jgi:photosystem II stability/assembly factor-like uncharacterized protein